MAPVPVRQFVRQPFRASYGFLHPYRGSRAAPCSDLRARERLQTHPIRLYQRKRGTEAEGLAGAGVPMGPMRVS
jgi:hypothetical protein